MAGVQKAVAGILFTAAALASSPAAMAAGPAGLEYVALGDSYSSGYGLPDPSDEPAPGCFQSPYNFPHQVAGALGLVLDDRSCSGAVTANIIDTPQTTDTGGTAPVQSDSLSTSTDIVTVMISGNDLGFFSIAESCLAKSPTGPVFGLYPNLYTTNTCRELYEPTPNNDFLTFVINSEVKPALATTFALIQQKAPNATVFVVGYPAITPPVDHCFSLPYEGPDIAPPFVPNSVPFVASDQTYLNQIEGQLDLAIQEAAAAHGFAYVPAFAQTTDHSLCTPQPWMNGFTLTSTPTPDPVPGHDGVYIALGTLHPNQLGADFLAEIVQAAILEAFPPLPATGSTVGVWPLVALGALVAGTLVLAIRPARRRTGSRPGPA